MTKFETRCMDCAEFKKGKCHEMWDKPIEEVEECPLGIEVEEVAEINEKAKDIKIDHDIKGQKKKRKAPAKPREIKVSDKKKEVFAMVWELLSAEYGENAKIKTENKLIFVKNGEKTIKIDFVDSKTVKFDE